MGFHHRAPPLLSALPCLLPLDIFRLVTLIYHRTEPPDAERSYRKCSVEGHSTVIKASSLFLVLSPSPLPRFLFLPVSSLMLSPSLCLPPPPPSFCPQSLLFPLVSLSVNLVAQKQDDAHFGALLFSALITAVKTNPAPTLSPSTPASFLLSALSVEGGGVFGPTSGELPLRRQRLRHGELLLTSADTQRDTKTPGSAHPRSLSKRLASRLVEHRKLLNLFFLFLAFCPMPHPGLVGLTGLFL